MIHIRAIYSLIEQEDAQGNRPVFAFKYITKAGEVIVCEQAVCSSSNFDRRTINVRMILSEETRTLNNIGLIEFNGQEVIL